MIAAEYHVVEAARKNVRRKMSPSLILHAFAVFGAFAAAAAGASGHACGFFLSQIDLAAFGFLGGIAGAVYAAILERPLSRD